MERTAARPPATPAPSRSTSSSEPVSPPPANRSPPERAWSLWKRGRGWAGDSSSLDTPFLRLDLAVVEGSYRRMRELFPTARIRYAVKANPLPELVRLLADLGSGFDVAGPAEIELCLAAGAPPARISYGNPAKKARDIAWAYARGVRCFVFDCAEELDKLARNAPGAGVACRLLASSRGARWPLAHKFGCGPEEAAALLLRARELGLRPLGAAFHVGSQQTDPEAWRAPLAEVARLYARLRGAGIEPELINLGGGFPAGYRDGAPPLEAFAARIGAALAAEFGVRTPAIVLEPGRSLVADAGVIVSEVVLVSRRSADDPVRWVYLDVGRFGGLAETEGESIRYRVRTNRDGGRCGPVVLAGPTCDSVDVLYRSSDYRLPLALRAGDRVEIEGAGAYTLSYASVGFNGFAPLRARCV